MLIKVVANGRIGIVEKIFHHPQASFKVATLDHRSILPPHILISASAHPHICLCTSSYLPPHILILSRLLWKKIYCSKPSEADMTSTELRKQSLSPQTESSQIEEGIATPHVQVTPTQNDHGLQEELPSAASAFRECKDLVLTTLELRPYAAPHGKKKDIWLEVIKSLNSRNRFLGKSVDYIQTRVKKLLAFHENGPKYIAEGVGFGVPKNIFGLSEQVIMALGGIIERLGDDITITEEERNTKTGNKRKAEQDEESRGKAIQRIALETHPPSKAAARS
ncbi:hypothetical protein HOY82DRAFT_637091 [Tuber indicum]|nr:hypothetical protein HOY82DRAFT_637091 [Tuber indicum]